MNSPIVSGVILRLIPSIVVLVLGFVAAADRGVEERWADLLYQTGFLPPDRKDDPAAQRGVRIPFFVFAVILLILPVLYFRSADRTLEMTPESDLARAAAHPQPTRTPAHKMAPTPNPSSGPGLSANAPAPPPVIPPPSAPASNPPGSTANAAAPGGGLAAPGGGIGAPGGGVTAPAKQ